MPQPKRKRVARLHLPAVAVPTVPLLSALPVPTRVTSRRLGDPRQVRFTPDDDRWLAETAKADSAATDSKIQIADVVRAAVSFYRQARERSAR